MSKKVELDKMSEKQMIKLQERLGKRLAKILNNASEKANKILNEYNLEIEVGYNIIQKIK